MDLMISGASAWEVEMGFMQRVSTGEAAAEKRFPPPTPSPKSGA
jgi:hypothetical protein